jgi:hypothetical protein
MKVLGLWITLQSVVDRNTFESRRNIIDVMDPAFDPLEDLQNCMNALYKHGIILKQHGEILDAILKAINNLGEENKNFKSLIKIDRHKIAVLETQLNEIKQPTTNNRQRRE